jgi:putative serine protease PepD
VLAALLGGIIGGLLVAAVFTWVVPPRTETAELSPAPAAVVASDTVEDQPIETVAADVVPSVVNVAITQNSGFFGPVSGNGSGVILTRDGFILTNNHVVEGATSIDVQLGTKDLAAKVVGTDPSSDLAVIKVDATGLTPARIGNSAALKVGQGVVAVGSPFGLDKTVTQGIVSALHRSDLNTGVAAYTNLIQTDAPINPGNSGGGLFDLQGNVVGINALIDTGNSGAAQSAGIGFSIPIDYANFIARQIIAGKKVQHPYLGVGTVDVTPPLASQNHLAVSSGALVQMVAQNSPAASAGIKDGDIIVSMGTQAITTSDEVVAAVRNARIGERLRIELVRGTAHVTVTVTMGSV